MPDLLLTRQTGSYADLETKTDVRTYYEIYVQIYKGSKSKYCLAAQDGQIIDPADKLSSQQGSAPMPLLEIADFNRDGMFDLAFMQESENGISLAVLLNQFQSQGPKETNLCNEVGQTQMLPNTPLFPVYPFEDPAQTIMETMKKWQNTEIVFTGITPSKPAGSGSVVPGRPRVADINQDGYPDIVLTLSFEDKSGAKNQADFTRTVILLNQAKSDGTRQFAQVEKDQ